MGSGMYRDGHHVEGHRNIETAPKRRKGGEEIGSVFRVNVSQTLSYKHCFCLSGVTVVT